MMSMPTKTRARLTNVQRSYHGKSLTRYDKKERANTILNATLIILNLKINPEKSKLKIVLKNRTIQQVTP